MEKILILLEERNRFLTQFLIKTQEGQVQFKGNDFSKIDEFYESRERLLEMVSEIERLIDSRLSGKSTDHIATELKKSIQTSLLLRDEIIQRILLLDLEILSLIDNKKSEIISDLQSIKAGRKLVSAYHSGQRDRQLDEEA